MSKNPPDLWARFFGGLGIAIGLCGLGLTYYNNRWQKEVYEKSLEERIFVQLNVSHPESYPVLKLSHEVAVVSDGERMELAVEVVNLGPQTIYLKSVIAQLGEHREPFYEHDPLNTKEPLPRLEPGVAASYKIDRTSAVYGTLEEDINKAKGRAIIEVETTKKRFSQSAQINRVPLIQEIPLNGRHFSDLKILTPRHRN